MILSAKVTFSKIGVISEAKKGTLFIPRVVLQIEGRKSAKTGYLVVLRERELTEEEIAELDPEN